MNDDARLYRVTVLVDFCYGHRLINYNGKCAHLHGHNGRVEVTFVEDRLTPVGFVVDFSDAKKWVKTWVDENWDHRMILHHNDPDADRLYDCDEKVRLVSWNPTAENMAVELCEAIKASTLAVGVPVASVRFWETRTSFAEVTG